MKGKDWKWLGVGALVLAGLIGLAIYRGLFRFVLFDPAWNYKGMAVVPGDCSAGNPEIMELPNGCLLMYTHGQLSSSTLKSIGLDSQSDTHALLAQKELLKF